MTSFFGSVRNLLLFAALAGCLLPTTAWAQSTPPFILEWQKRNAPLTKPPGNDFSWNFDPTSPVYTPTARANAIPQSLDESGADWWHSVIPIVENGLPAGYVAVGYTSFINWGVSDGCYNYVIANGTYPVTVLNQRFDRRRSQVRNAVARFDLTGNLVWYKT